MNISNVQVGGAFGVPSSMPSSVTPRRPEPDRGLDVGRPGTRQISGMAQQMNHLQELQQQDPARFVEAVTQIADVLRSASQSQPANGSVLRRAADAFAAAAQTREMPALTPHAATRSPSIAPPPPDNPYGARAGYANAYAQPTTAASWQTIENAMRSVLEQPSR